MKKRVILALCLLLAMVMCACGKNVGETSGGDGSSDVSSEVADATTEADDDTEEKKAEDQIPEEYAASVIVTINPKVKLYLDEDSVVIGVEYLNEDARIVYADIDFSGATVEECMGEMVDAAIEKEFLTNGKEISIDIAEVKDEAFDSTAVSEELEAAVKKVTEEKQLEAEISVQISAEPVNEASATETIPSNPCSNCGGTGKCDECLGDGYRGSGFTVSCPRCHGALTETCIYCDASGNSLAHEGTCDFPNCMGSHVYSCTTCGGGTTPVTCASCNGSGKCKVCGGSGAQ